MITDEKLARINELARKAKAEGLTSAETKERDVLRREYIEAVRANLRRFLHSGQKQVKHLCSSRVL